LPELEWLFERYGDHPALGGFLLGDDYGALPKELVETTDFLRENAPHLFPWVCQNVMSGVSLATAGNPIMDPQIYPTLYQRDRPAADQAQLLCKQLQQLREACMTYNLIPWPMVNVHGVPSDSMNRFQVYASLAYGAQGIWYFTYSFVMSNDMLSLQNGTGYDTEEAVAAHLTPIWPIIAGINERVAFWGPELLGRIPQAIYHTGPWPSYGALARASEAPGEGKRVEAMDEDLLVGILIKPGAAPLAMVVDKRVDLKAGALEPRDVTLRFGKDVASVAVIERGASKEVPGASVALTLPAGGGQLLRLNVAGAA